MKRLAKIFVLMSFAFAGQAFGSTDVWLDVDPAAGLRERDVDDALALIQAFHSPELNIRGVSVVYGNAPLHEGLPIAEDVVEAFGPDGMAVYAGAASAADRGKTTPAVEGMRAALNEKPLTILALGPLTNVATLLQRHPDAADRIDAIVAVAGRRPGQRFTTDPAKSFAFPDFNFENDPAAMEVILDSPVKLVLAPWEVSSHVFIEDADLARLKASGAAGAWIAEKAQSWIAMWQRDLGADGFNPFDTLAVGWVTHPALIKSIKGNARIEYGGPELGGRPANPDAEPMPYLLVEPGDESGKAVVYCYEPDPYFKAILLNRLAGPAELSN